ncbi:hypothetical protein [Microvirga calopogonii]|uniref:hypothetical protein n=1 Tax=Microvirga calopogonii TaxID=2078013 RepID=UPI0013B4435E|nr:hypothetical protein [Microvirga calopogonii]
MTFAALPQQRPTLIMAPNREGVIAKAYAWVAATEKCVKGLELDEERETWPAAASAQRTMATSGGLSTVGDCGHQEAVLAQDPSGGAKPRT